MKLGIESLKLFLLKKNHIFVLDHLQEKFSSKSQFFFFFLKLISSIFLKLRKIFIHSSWWFFFFNFFFWGVDSVNSGHLNNRGSNFGPLLPLSSFFLLPPLSLFTSFFHLDFLLPYTISSLKENFPKLLNLPSFISLNIFSDPCVIGHFCYTPILRNPFSNFLFLCIDNVTIFQ